MSEEKNKSSSIAKDIETKVLLDRSLCDWRPILAKECQVYVCGASYIGKRFDEINYNYMDKDTAKECIIDNLYAILRYKYFIKRSDECDKKIDDIIKSFTANLKSTLIKVSFDKLDKDAKQIRYIPDSCVAFRNGVYDFWEDKWLMEYDIVHIEETNNNIYMYDPSYVIMWYFNFDFSPIEGLSLKDMEVEDAYGLFKSIVDTLPYKTKEDKEESNKYLCFKLLHNISYDAYENFDKSKFSHLCQILGYTLCQSFIEAFIMLIGSGQNGKNSLFDGCFTNRLVPRPTAISMKDIEEDKFVTGSLINSRHNIFLETEAATQTKSAMIKQLTGSQFQSIQPKGIQAYPGIINSKFIFAGNDQEKIKFSDTTHGFRRRINIYEIYYTYKPEEKRNKSKGIYQTDFHDDLRELKNYEFNTIIYIYFAMFGIKKATNCFEDNFKIKENDWRLSYSDIDYDLKERLENITINDLIKYFSKNPANKSSITNHLFDTNPGKKLKLLNSDKMIELKVHSENEFIEFLKDDEKCNDFFNEYDIYITGDLIKEIISYPITSISSLNTQIKKIFPDCKYERNGPKTLFLVGITNNRLKFRTS